MTAPFFARLNILCLVMTFFRRIFEGGAYALFIDGANTVRAHHQSNPLAGFRHKKLFGVQIGVKLSFGLCM